MGYVRVSIKYYILHHKTKNFQISSGKCYFRGPWFICPSEVPNPTNKLYYRNEVLLSTEEDVNPIVSIIGKCAVLDYNDYVSRKHRNKYIIIIYNDTSVANSLNI